MSQGHLDIRLRPVKFALLVDFGDSASLEKAIKLNSSLWGGVFNPIIPFFSKLPKIYRDKHEKNLSSRVVLKGYLDTYDPDFIVDLRKSSHHKLDIGTRNILTESQIFKMSDENVESMYGVNIFQILQYVINKELKYVREEPLSFNLPIIGRRYNLFLQSVFGSLPEEAHTIFKKYYEQKLNVQWSKCQIDDFTHLLINNNFFFRRFVSLYIKPIAPHRFWGRDCIFFLDASKSIDIIDYWNLRASGRNILPIPIQSYHKENIKDIASKFIESNYFPDSINPKIYHQVRVIKSRSAIEYEFNNFIESLKFPSSRDGGMKLVIQKWYPRFWNEWDREHNNAQCSDLVTDKSTIQFAGEEESIDFKILDPKFLVKHRLSGFPRFANELHFRIYSKDELYAEVIPEGDENIIKALGGWVDEKWRFSKNGPVYLSPYTDWHITLSMPKAIDVFFEWLNYRNWNIKLSPSGYIGYQMLKQLGGISGINILSEGIIRLLITLEDGKIFKKEKLWGEMAKISEKEKFFKRPTIVINRLLKHQVIRMGLEIQCPICRQHVWYSLSEMDYNLQCYKCLAEFNTISFSPNDFKWGYRTYGPFSLPNAAQGVYSVLLTLRFFSSLLHGATTPLLSFERKMGNKWIEIDLALMYKKTVFRESV